MNTASNEKGRDDGSAPGVKKLCKFLRRKGHRAWTRLAARQARPPPDLAAAIGGCMRPVLT